MHQPEDLQKLSTINPQEYADNAIRFFDEHLDAKIYWEMIWKEMMNRVGHSKFNRCQYNWYECCLYIGYYKDVLRTYATRMFKKQ